MGRGRQRGKQKEYDVAISITTGMDEDLEVFIFKVFSQFEKQKGPRFSVFVSEWKKSGCGLLWCGRDSFRDMYDFTEELFHRVKKYLMPSLHGKPNHTLVRYAGLYLMYSLYFKQPCRPRVHFRLVKQEFQNILDLKDLAQKDKHWDVMYAWSKLFTNHAFYYTASHSLLGVEMAYQSEQRELSEKFNANNSQDYCKSTEFVRMMGKISKSHSKYVDMKKQLANNKDPEDSSLFMIDASFPTSLKQVSLTHDKEETIKKAKELSKVGQSRRNLKNKFYGLGEDTL